MQRNINLNINPCVFITWSKRWTRSIFILNHVIFHCIVYWTDANIDRMKSSNCWGANFFRTKRCILFHLFFILEYHMIHKIIRTIKFFTSYLWSPTWYILHDMQSFQITDTPTRFACQFLQLPNHTNTWKRDNRILVHKRWTNNFPMKNKYLNK